ncbi:hypothetical protein KDA23_00505 [Candidatus Saccharibacteria bacterium]|nr:hypothetical protein [Candidatus Saccharibacteria bacterium]
MEKDTSIIDERDLKKEPQASKGLFGGKKLKLAMLAIALIILAPLSYAGYIYAASPSAIRNPLLEHYHFRMQVVVDGQAENFAEDRYQEDYAKNQCNGNLTEQPIHFHDGVDQFTHIHWEGMTGGMVMKYYGWNYIGGINNALGYKLDDLSDIQKVNTHGNFLPEISEDNNFYIYTGDADNYQEKSFDDWVNKDLEEFFETTSNFPAHQLNKQSSFLDKLFPKAYAHGEVEDDHSNADESEEERLTRINNLIGNVVIFVQAEPPSNEEITERFNNLAPLTDSTCGG